MRLKTGNFPRTCVWFTLAFLLLSGPGAIEAQNRRSGETGELPPRVVLDVWPAAVPDPVLRYRLLPGYGERRPGNAAVFYGKVTAEQSAYHRREFWDEYEKLSELDPTEQMKSPLLDQFASTPGYFMLRAAALCDSCDWQHPLRDQNAIMVLLPEVQQTRNFSRLLALQTLRQIRDRDLEGAIESLQTGFALGVNVSDTPILVSKLVGIAICRMMSQPLEVLVQQPETPSLYWAIATLPHPLIGMFDAYEAESDLMLKNMPGFDQLDSESNDVAFWSQQYGKAVECIQQISQPGPGQGPAELALAIPLYQKAKRILQASGVSASELDAMPVGKVILMAERKEYLRLSQLQAAQASLPWYSRIELQQAANDGSSTMLTHSLVSATIRIHQAWLQPERWLRALQTVEALRHYAATHQGALPDSLEQLVETPAPDDPATGRPFEYSREGNVAIVEGPDIQQGVPFGYEVRMNPPAGIPK